MSALKNLWYIYTIKYYSAIKKKEILPFTTEWTDLKSNMLSEISQSEKETPYDFTHMWNLMSKLN